jgi:hypothetical protein
MTRITLTTLVTMLIFTWITVASAVSVVGTATIVTFFFSYVT